MNKTAQTAIARLRRLADGTEDRTELGMILEAIAVWETAPDTMERLSSEPDTPASLRQYYIISRFVNEYVLTGKA